MLWMSATHHAGKNDTRTLRRKKDSFGIWISFNHFGLCSDSSDHMLLSLGPINSGKNDW